MIGQRVPDTYVVFPLEYKKFAYVMSAVARRAGPSVKVSKCYAAAKRQTVVPL